MVYVVYKIVNNANGMYYFGMYGRKNPTNTDGYLGSGREIRKAVKAFGKENFSKTILHTFTNEAEALAKEAELAKPEDPNSYNVNRGGHSWHYVNTALPSSAIGRGNGGANKGKRYGAQTVEHRKAISRAHTGKSKPWAQLPKSETHKQRISAARLKSEKVAAASAVRILCPHCGKRADSGNYNRWHGDRCRSRNQGSISASQ